MSISGATINAHGVSGLYHGVRRETLKQARADDQQGKYYQQDRSIAASAGNISPDVPVGKQLGAILIELAEKNADAESSAAIALAHVDVRDTPDGRKLTIDAACMGDCDVYLAISPADGSAPSVQRLFDDVDFSEQFDGVAQATRKLIAGIGSLSEPEAMYQRYSVNLKPGETATVFTASDGYWDGHAVLAHPKADGLSDQQAHARMTGQIGRAVMQGLAHGDDSAMSAVLTGDLLEKSEQADIPNTDNISATAAVIRPDGKAPEAFIIGSIDGAGAIGPTEEMVDGMVADIHAKLGPSLLVGNDNRHDASLTAGLDDWRERRQRSAGSKPAATRPALGRP